MIMSLEDEITTTEVAIKDIEFEMEQLENKGDYCSDRYNELAFDLAELEVALRHLEDQLD